MRNIIACLPLAALLISVNSFSQPASSANDSSAASAAKVYIDCDACDFDFVKTEITFVNFVRDRTEADVHIIVSKLQNAAGGYEYTVEFRGLNSFAGMTDTLKTYSLETDSDDLTRKKLVRTFKLGLMRYVARTPLGNQVTVSYNRPALKTETIDKWNGWVVSIDVSAYFNGEQSSRFTNLYGDLQIRRVTEVRRFTFEIYGQYIEDWRSYEEYETRSISRSRGADASYLFGLDNHWSLGAGIEWFMSSYSNYDHVWEWYPTIEYNIFPYSEATRRQLRIQYLAALKFNDYETETIYGKTSECLGLHKLSANLKFIQPWGSMGIWISGSHYFHDFSKNRLEVGTDLSLKLVKGLSLTVNGNYARIHDQVSLAKGDASQEELLLQRRQLATSYSYYISIGLKYSFGSIYSNVVNPRFGY
jgi:hypothetical protein